MFWNHLNKIIVLILLVCSLSSTAQFNLAKRTTLEAHLGVRAHGYLYSDLEEGIIPERFFSIYPEVQIKTRVSRKVAIGALYGYSKKKVLQADRFREVVPSSDHTISLVEYGVTLSYFTQDNFAPIGNNISFTYKQSNATIVDLEVYDINTNTTTKADVVNNTFALILSYNGMRFLSKKAPIYFHYSLGVGYRNLYSDVRFGGKLIEEDDNTEVEDAVLPIRGLLYKKQLFEAKLGLGYWF